MYGKLCHPPKGAIIRRVHWQYCVMSCSKRRSCQCCDGSTPSCRSFCLHAMAETTYASCIEQQPVFRFFLAFNASLSYLIFGGDAQYPFTPLLHPLYLPSLSSTKATDTKYGIRLKRGIVLPVLSMHGARTPQSCSSLGKYTSTPS